LVFDEETGPDGIIFTVTSPPTSGQLHLLNNPTTTFTQEDIADDRVTYVHNGNEPAAESFGFSASDGELAVTGTFTITITPVNDPPVLTNNGLTLDEGGDETITNAMLSLADPDNSDTELVF